MMRMKRGTASLYVACLFFLLISLFPGCESKVIGPGNWPSYRDCEKGKPLS
jgi:hypothetical protein